MKLSLQSQSPRNRLTLSTKLCLQSQSPRDRLTLSTKLCMQLVAALCQRYDKTHVTMSTASLLDCDDLIHAARIGSLLLRSEHPSWRYVGTIPDGSHRPAHGCSLRHSLGKLHLQQEGAAGYEYPTCLFGTLLGSCNPILKKASQQSQPQHQAKSKYKPRQSVHKLKELN